MRRFARRHRTGPQPRQKQKKRREQRGSGRLESIANGFGAKSMKNILRLHRKVLIGVVHLKPLPGAARHRASMAEIIKAAVADAVAYERGGAHGVFIENFGDVPFTKSSIA